MSLVVEFSGVRREDDGEWTKLPTILLGPYTDVRFNPSEIIGRTEDKDDWIANLHTFSSEADEDDGWMIRGENPQLYECVLVREMKEDDQPVGDFFT